MSQQYDNTMITFHPTMRCQDGDCTELTTVAMLELGDDYSDLPFHPTCPAHGYAYGCTLEQEYQSIIRFVLSEFDGQGTARVLGPCELDEVPGYEVEDVNGVASTEIDSAWTVRYTDTEGKESTLFVVWEIAYLSFYLYTFAD